MQPVDRHQWAASLLDVQPHEQVLEVGCGYGLTAALVAERLETGQLVAIDRSEKVLAKAQEKLAAHVASGRVRFLQGHMENLTGLPEGHFDKAFAFNLNLFMKSGLVEVQRLRQLLKPNGLFYVFFDLPGTVRRTWLQQLEVRMGLAGFKVLRDEKMPFTHKIVVGIVCQVA